MEKDHDKAASRLLTILLGTLQTYAEGMALLDKTSAARADLKELLGPLGELSNEAGCLKLLDLVYYFADLAERELYFGAGPGGANADVACTLAHLRRAAPRLKQDVDEAVAEQESPGA